MLHFLFSPVTEDIITYLQALFKENNKMNLKQVSRQYCTNQCSVLHRSTIETKYNSYRPCSLLYISCLKLICAWQSNFYKKNFHELNETQFCIHFCLGKGLFKIHVKILTLHSYSSETYFENQSFVQSAFGLHFLIIEKEIFSIT